MSAAGGAGGGGGGDESIGARLVAAKEAARKVKEEELKIAANAAKGAAVAEHPMMTRSKAAAAVAAAVAVIPKTEDAKLLAATPPVANVASAAPSEASISKTIASISTSSEEEVEHIISNMSPTLLNWVKRLFGLSKNPAEGVLPVAKGGQGQIFLFPLRSGTTIVIKENQFSDPGYAALFDETTNIASQLKHLDFVPKYIASDRTESTGFMAMRYISGKTLADEIVGGLTAEDKREIFRQIVLNLHTLHKEGVVHHDLKPQNIMVDRKYGLKVYFIDFDSAGWINDPYQVQYFFGLLHKGRPETPGYSSSTNRLESSFLNNIPTAIEEYITILQGGESINFIHPLRDVYSVWRIWNKLYSIELLGSDRLYPFRIKNFITFVCAYFPESDYIVFVIWYNFTYGPRLEKKEPAEAQANLKRAIDTGAAAVAPAAGGKRTTVSAAAVAAAKRGGYRKSRSKKTKKSKKISQKKVTRRYRRPA